MNGTLPIMIGGAGPKVTLKLVAKHAQWWHSFGSPRVYAQKSEILAEHCAKIGRDPAEIKRKFGDHLCFWGSIDEQHTLPFGSPQEVADEVCTRLQTLGKNGGLILGPTHHVQLDTPMENFWAMVNTIKQTPYPS